MFAHVNNVADPPWLDLAKDVGETLTRGEWVRLASSVSFEIGDGQYPNLDLNDTATKACLLDKIFDAFDDSTIDGGERELGTDGEDETADGQVTQSRCAQKLPSQCAKASVAAPPREAPGAPRALHHV